MKRPIKIALAVVGAIFALCILCFVIALIYNATPAGKASQTEIAQAKETTAAAPTNTPKPTNTEKPSNTPAPTNTKRPTNTPAPTKTKKPTLTPKPPTKTLAPTNEPDPVILTGSGDSIVDFENPFGIAIVHITGNSSSRHFAVTSYGENGETIELLVNTTDAYDGIRPLDFMEGQHTTRFEVKANGEWTIEVLPISSARVIDIPGSIEGVGDEVIVLSGSPPDTATITGNDAGRHFAVISYGKISDLLVNTTDPYNGTVIMQTGTILIEIKAIGPWTIDIKAK
jgi:hypothetical protein